MDLTNTPMGATLTEWDGQPIVPPLIPIVPPLIRTPRGWIEQAPSRCEDCGGDSVLIGWTACACRTDTLGPGHRTWTCQKCGQHKRVGCLDAAAQRDPMDEYGCRRDPR